MSLGRGDFDAELVRLLGPRAGEAVLEIGVGPGLTLASLLAAHPDLRVAGADPSAVMIAHARKRNADALADGRLRLDLASAEKLPYGDSEFDRALTVNSVGHWRSVSAGLAELQRVLRPGGHLAIASRKGLSAAKLTALERALSSAGFTSLCSERVGTGRHRGAAVIATAP